MAGSAASAGSAAGRRIDGEAAKLPLQSQVVGLERARVDVEQNQVGCPSYVGFVRPICRKRRSRRFAESSPTAPTKAELDLVVADAVEAPARAVAVRQIQAWALISPMAATARLRLHQPSLPSLRPTQGLPLECECSAQAVSDRCFRFWNAVSSGEAQGTCH